jgi:hypothetical protein
MLIQLPASWTLPVEAICSNLLILLVRLMTMLLVVAYACAHIIHVDHSGSSFPVVVFFHLFVQLTKSDISVRARLVSYARLWLTMLIRFSAWIYQVRLESDHQATLLLSRVHTSMVFFLDVDIVLGTSGIDSLLACLSKLTRLQVFRLSGA